MGVCYFRRIFFGVCYHCQFLCIFKRGQQRFLNRIIFSTCLQFKKQLWILNIVSVCFTCFMNFNFCQDSGTLIFFREQWSEELVRVSSCQQVQVEGMFIQQVVDSVVTVQTYSFNASRNPTFVDVGWVVRGEWYEEIFIHWFLIQFSSYNEFVIR